MLKRSFLVSIFSVLLFLSGISYAIPIVYTLNYSPNATSTPVSLKNTDLQLQLFADGSPRGIMSVTTDANQAFMLNSPYDQTFVVAVTSIKGTPENMLCQGVSQIGKTDIIIECRNR